MGCHVSRSCVRSVLPKFLCIILLIVQLALLDYIIIRLDTEASDMGRYIWIGVDFAVVIFWIIALIYSYRNFEKSNKNTKLKKMPVKGFSGKQICLLALRELSFTYVSWLLYAIILIVKMNRMFLSFAEALTSNAEESLLSSTSLKIIMSFAGVLFALLAYAHQDETHNSEYKLNIEKIGTAASIDLLDGISLLDALFVFDNHVLLTFTMDRTIRAFSSICILLPVFPLLALRIVASSETAKSSKSFPLAMILNSALYMLFLNIPWFHHDADVSTFLTKNVMEIAKCLFDIYSDLLDWNRNRKKNVEIESKEVQMEPVQHT